MNETAHILVVDDDQSVRRVFQQILTTSGYRISTANSGEEALAYLDLITPDLILMDLNLPGITGIETITRIKADTTKPFISVMLVTARGDQAAKVQGLDAGADDFLVKPVDLTELLARVRALLRLQSSHRSLYAEQRKTELLLHLTRALSTTLDFDQLLTHFLNRLSDSIGAIRASIILIIDEQPRLYSSTGRMPQTPLPHILREGVAGWVLRNRHPIIIEDTRQDTRWIAQNPHQQVVRSIAATPIIRDERTFGVITLMHHTPGYFNDEHIDLLNTVATQCAFALENAELFELTRQQKDLLERRAEELERINQVSQYLSELMSPEQLLRQVVEVVHTSFGYPRVAMLLREGNELVIRAAAGDRVALGRLGERQPADAGYSGWAAAHQEPLCIIHIPQDSHEPLVGDTDARSIVAIPIRSSRGAFGVLEVTSPVVDAFGQDDLRLLGTLAGQLGVALQNAQLYDDEQNRVRQLERVNSLSISMTAQFGQATDLAIAAEAINTIFRVETSALVVRGTPPRAAFHSRSAVVQRLTLPTSALTAINLTGLETVVDVHNGQQLEGALDWLERAGITSLALVPLLAGRDQIGLILIDITGHTEQVARGELTLLETIASLIAQAIQNSRLYTQVESERSTVNAVLEGAADSILLIDQQEQLRLANRAAIERFGLTDPIGHP
jgi:adenylate cyclase